VRPEHLGRIFQLRDAKDAERIQRDSIVGKLDHYVINDQVFIGAEGMEIISTPSGTETRYSKFGNPG
jgi:hypothetical protein